jgi:hydroxyacylglutathione hydrolase
MDIIVKNSKLLVTRFSGRRWANAYLIICLKTGASVLIDAPGSADLLLKALRDTDLKYILMTHNHSDHIGALAKLKSTFDIPVCGNTGDASGYPVLLDKQLTDKARVVFGKLEFKVFHTPGHTPGSLCFLIDKYLFAGDTLFPGGPGYTVTPDDLETILKSIKNKLINLPADTVVFPGHGDPTVLGKETGNIKSFLSKPHKSGLCGDVVWVES